MDVEEVFIPTTEVYVDETGPTTCYTIKDGPSHAECAGGMDMVTVWGCCACPSGL